MAQRVVGDVAVRVGADVGPLKIGLQDAGRSVDRFGNNTRRRFATLARNLRNVGLAAGAMAGALSAASRSAIRDLDDIGKTADKIGLTTDALQELRFAAEQTGVPVRTLDMAMQRFTRRVAEARQGSGEAKAALEEMGIALFNTDGTARNIDIVLNDVADAMTELESQSDRVRIAMRLFDSEGVAMVNTLADGSAGLRGMRQEARDLGIVIKEDVIRSAEDMNDELDAVTRVIKAELTEALVQAGPWLVGMAKGLAAIATAASTALTKVGEFANGIFSAISRSKEELEGLETLSERRAERNARRANKGQGGTGSDATPPVDILGDFFGDGSGAGNDPRSKRARELAAERAAAEAAAERDAQNAVSDARLIAIAEAAERERQAQLEQMAETSDAKLIALAEEHERQKEQAAAQAEELAEQERAAGARRVEEARMTEEQITEIMRAEQRARLDAIGSAFGDLASLMRTGNEKLFRIGQAAAVAEAVVSGYRAAVEAWEKGMSIGGPPLAAAFTAASLAKTGALIASIKSAQPSGGSGAQSNPGSGASGGGTIDAEGERRVRREITVNLRGGLAGQASGMRDVLAQINEELGDGADLAVNLI